MSASTATKRTLGWRELFITVAVLLVAFVLGGPPDRIVHLTSGELVVLVFASLAFAIVAFVGALSWVKDALPRSSQRASSVSLLRAF